LNNYLTDNSESTAYLTVFMSVLNIETGALEYVNGGHLSPYILKKNKTLESLETKNLICGMFNDVVYDVGVTTIEPGDALFIFTDGITEAQAADESMYGDESLKTVIKSLDATQSASEQVGRILKSVKDFVKDAPQSDDITILSVKALE
ncbi:MAG TPA: PP2C family protein-serine/threonine phosphatase, partial [Candidatus Wallbacteria bacterium]|nr:PP2C family protein-serine/threonine phosphatase [Candidatus Wallbacteria bacterium]